MRTGLGVGTSPAQGVFLEMFATCFLVLSVLILAAEKSQDTLVGIGMVFFVCHLFILPYTGASINPAQSFGPASIYGFDRIHWVIGLGFHGKWAQCRHLRLAEVVCL